jgi:hypothetical protein
MEATATQQPLLNFDQFQAIFSSPNFGTKAGAMSQPEATSNSGAGAEASSLLAQLDLALPAGPEGHGVTSDTRLKDRLIAFLGLDPSTVAADLKNAVNAGTVSDAQYSQIANLLRAQAGIAMPAAVGVASPPAPASSNPAPVTPVAVEPSVIQSAEKATAALSDPKAVFIQNPEPAKMVHRFVFEWPQGEAFKAWMTRSYGGISAQNPWELSDGEVLEEILNKAMNGEDLTEDEYKAVWEGIRAELGRNRGEWHTDVSKEVDREVLALGDGVTTTQGYLFEKDEKFFWMDESGKETELSYPKDDNSTDAPGSIVLKGTSAAINGDYSIPEDKRGPVVEFLQSLTQTSETPQLIEAVQSGKISAEQHSRILLLADQAKVVAAGGTVDDLYADTAAFSAATGAPIYTLEQHLAWL